MWSAAGEGESCGSGRDGATRGEARSQAAEQRAAAAEASAAAAGAEPRVRSLQEQVDALCRCAASLEEELQAAAVSRSQAVGKAPEVEADTVEASSEPCAAPPPPTQPRQQQQQRSWRSESKLTKAQSQLRSMVAEAQASESGAQLMTRCDWRGRVCPAGHRLTGLVAWFPGWSGCCGGGSGAASHGDGRKQRQQDPVHAVRHAGICQRSAEAHRGAGCCPCESR